VAIKSTTLRLLLVFGIALLVLIALFQAVVGHSLQREAESLNAESVLRMTRVIIKQRSGGEVDFQRAARFAERSGLRFHIKTNEHEWLSDDSFQTVVEQSKFEKFKHLKPRIFRDPPFKNSRRHPAVKVELAKLDEFFIYRVTTPKSVLLIEILNETKGVLGLLILVALFFLGLMYAAIRYLFAPLKDIRRVVSEVSQGNLTARTNINRNDDFGDLAEKVNYMTEQIKQRVESKHSLLMGISHELRSPLTRARISTEMLQDPSRKQAITEDLVEMESIISELMEAEKLSEHTAIHRSATDINQLVSDLLRESFSKQKLNFETLDGDPFINIDATRIKLLIKNLLSNAIQYTPEGGLPPRLELSLNDDQLMIQVVDFGVGIAADQLEKLKEPFYRIDSARQRETGGYGLGLYLCNVISTAHGGELKLSSEKGKGTTAKAVISLVA